MDKQVESMLEMASIKPEGGAQVCTLQLSLMAPGGKPYTDQIVFTKDQSAADIIHGLRCLANRIHSNCIEMAGARVQMQSEAQTKFMEAPLSLKYRRAQTR